MANIRETNVASSPGRIRPTEAAKAHVSFSLKYLQATEKFNYSRDRDGYFQKVVERLRDLSTLTAQEIVTNRSKALRAHSIRWEDTSEKSFGIPREPEVVETPYQFEISANEHGRVHGFFIASTFYIRWFDPNHLLYSQK